MRKRQSPALLNPAALVTNEGVQALDLAAEPINAFETALGGRAELIKSLSIDATPEIKDLVEMLLDPTFDKYSLGYLATQVAISLTDILRAFRNGLFFKAHLLASQQITAKLPEIVEDVMKRAAPHDEPCPTCDGTTQVVPAPTKKNPNPSPQKCQVCNGKGIIRHIPEVDRQRLALELGELIKPPKHAPTLLQQFNLGGSQPLNPSALAPGSLEQMQQAVTDLLYGNRRTISVPAEPENETTSDSAPLENMPYSQDI